MNTFHITGLLILVVSVFLACWKLATQRRWMKAQGEVVTLGPERTGETPDQPISGIYSPVVKFLTQKNELVCEEVHGIQFGPAAVGDSVIVLYDPENPAHFCSAKLMRRFYSEAALAFLSIFIILIPLV